MVFVHALDGSAAPELLRLELLAQIEVFRVLAAVNLGPACGEFHPHAGKVVAGARIDETDLAAFADGVGAEEEPVAQGGVQHRLGVGGVGPEYAFALQAEGGKLGGAARHERDGQRTMGSILVDAALAREGGEFRRRLSLRRFPQLLQALRELPAVGSGDAEKELVPSPQGSHALNQSALRDLVVSLQHHMAHAAIHAEDADAGVPRPFAAVSEPVARAAREKEGSAAGEFAHGTLAGAGPGDDLLVQGEAAAHQRGEAGSGSAMADVGLHAGYRQTPLLRHGTRLIEEFGQGCGFHPVFGRVTAAVGFEEADPLRSNPCLTVGTLQRVAVRVGAGEHDGAAGGADAADHGVDPVSVALCVLQALQDHRRGTLADDGAVGGLVEGGGAAKT